MELEVLNLNISTNVALAYNVNVYELLKIMGKNKHVKSNWINKNTKCSCYYCLMGGVERWQKLKYQIQKHRKKYLDNF